MRGDGGLGVGVRRSRGTRPLRSLTPVLAPVVIGAAFWAVGWSTRAIALWGIAALTAVLVVVGVPVERYLARLASAAAHAVGLVASLLVGVLLVGAGGAVRCLGRDPLTPQAQRGPTWVRIPAGSDSKRFATTTFSLDRAAAPASTSGGLRTLGRGLTLGVGSVVLLLLADLGVGLAWERVTTDADPSAAVDDRVNFTGTSETFSDPRADGPAMAEYPWADAYFRELQMTPSSYWPFTESRPMEFRGNYITVQGWSRRSYVPSGLPDDAPVVWMFGGSTTWGEGQRDDYTIASHLARIAEREGSPVRVVNFGQRGWTHFQEMILFEQLLAEGPPPDVAIFYDGANEITSQSLSAKGVPSHTMVDQYAQLISGGISDEFTRDEDLADPPSNAALAWDAYLGHSAIQKLVRRAKESIDPPAGALESSASEDADGGGPASGQNYDLDVRDAERAVDVYERGRALTAFLADEYDVQAAFYWQPVTEAEPQAWANDHISAPTINISDALDDHREVFIDSPHTNEEGARLVAERIWESLRQRISTVAAGREGQRLPPLVTTTTAAPTSSVPSTVQLSDSEVLDRASAELDAASGRPCAVAAWSRWLGTMRAAGPEELDRFVDIGRRYLEELVHLASDQPADSVATVQRFASQLRAIVDATEVDPRYPVAAQLAGVNDPESSDAKAVSGLSDAVGRRCAAEEGAP